VRHHDDLRAGPRKRPSRKPAVAWAAEELAAIHRVQNDRGILSEPYHEGQPGRMLRTAKACTAEGAASTVPPGGHGAGRLRQGRYWWPSRCDPPPSPRPAPAE
jgi:hypothetical protein